jgi:hypothetical protein
MGYTAVSAGVIVPVSQRCRLLGHTSQAAAAKMSCACIRLYVQHIVMPHSSTCLSVSVMPQLLCVAAAAGFMLASLLTASGVLQGMPDLTEGSDAEDDDGADDWLDDEEEVRQIQLMC